MDYIYTIRERLDPDPSGSKSPIGYFQHYKWHVEGETFVAIRPDNRVLFEEIQAGDRLWIGLDRDCTGTAFLFGYVTVLRVQEDPFNGYLEIWYDGEKCHELERDKQITLPFGPFGPMGRVAKPPIETEE